MKLLLLGDICPTAASAPFFKVKDISTLFTDTLSLFEGKDLIVANLECALTEATEEIKKFGPALKAPKETAEVLREIGVDVCALANNHVFDFGTKGLRDTLAALDENGIAYTGVGENEEDAKRDFFFEKDGKRICVIAACEHEYSYALQNRMGARGYDEYQIPEAVRRAKESCERVIVLYHGGKEFCPYPSPRIRRIGQALVRSGADVVLFQHSHTIGAYEAYEGGHILYGQGNFHFVKLLDVEEWKSALAVEYDTESGEVTFIPIVEGENGIALAKGDEHDEIMAKFAAYSKSLADGMWREGWHAFCESKKKSYMSTICNAARPDSTEYDNAAFAHNLDCEAHTDVWRELFPTYNHTNCIEE